MFQVFEPIAMAISVGVDEETGEDIIVMETTCKGTDGDQKIAIAYDTDQILEFRAHLDKALELLSGRNDGYLITD